MKVAYLLSRAKNAGPTNQSLNILLGLKMSGIVDAILVTFDPEDPNDTWLNRFIDAGIKVHQFNIPSKNILKSVIALRNFIQKEKIDLIHGCGTRVDIIAYLSKTRAKRVITHRSYPDMIAERNSAITRSIVVPIYMHVMKSMDKVVACSYSMQKAFKEQCSINLEVVQNAVNTDYFVPVDDNRKKELRSKLNIADTKTFLVLGSLLARKNNLKVIEAINSYKEFVGQILFVGSGDEEALLRNAAGNNQHIHFVGATTTPIDYLQASDYFISASLSEGLPNSVLEAISCGLVPILSDIGPHREIVENTTVDFRFDPADYTDLVRCLRMVSKVEQNTLSLSSRKLSIERFGIEAMAAKYIEIYKSALQTQN